MIKKTNESKIIITGASGFIGTHLLSHLSRLAGCCVVTLDHQTIQSKKEEDLVQILSGADSIIHLAGVAHNKKAPPKMYQKGNIDLTKKLANCAVKAHIPHFIFASTIGVNGVSTSMKKSFTSQDVPAPQTLYALSKKHAEEALNIILKDTDTALTIIRPPLVYHPQAPGNIALLRKAIKKRWPLPLARIYNHKAIVKIDDLCDLLIQKAIEKMPSSAILLPVSKHLSTPDLVRELARDLNCTTILWPCPLFILKAAAYLIGRQSMMEQLTSNLRIAMNHHL